MASIASSEIGLGDNFSLYKEMLPETNEILSQIAEDPEFCAHTRIKTVEVALKVLRNGEPYFYRQIVHQHKWSWPIFILLLPFAPIAPALYIVYHSYQQSYSSQKIHDLVKKGLELDLLPTDVLVSCTIKVTVGHNGIFKERSYQAEKTF